MKRVFIKDLLNPYKEMALIEQEAQGNERNEKIKLDKSTHQGNFKWQESILGYSFWANVCSQDYPEITPEIKAKFPSVFKVELIEKWEREIERLKELANSQENIIDYPPLDARADQLKRCIKDYQEFINLKK
jgi:hypothetical protein